MFTRYFTPKEANQRLPLIKKIVAEILQNGQALQALSQDQNFSSLQAQKLEAEIGALMRELEGHGCYYKDWNFEIGLVDFPSKRGEEEVFLCWRSDEERVAWYHGVEEGYAGRQPIPLDDLL